MKKLLTFFLALCTFFSLAQNPKIDSLRLALKNYDAKNLELRKNLIPNESDTAKFNILKAIGMEYMKVSDYDPAEKYLNEALTLAQQIGFKKGISACYNNFGIICRKQGNYPQALKNHFAALKIREETGDKNGIAASYNNIGNIYNDQGNYPEALKSQLASLKIKEEIGDKEAIAGCFNNIGLIFLNQWNQPEALNYFTPALKIYRETGNKNGEAICSGNIGMVYERQGKHEEALKNYSAALKLYEEEGDKDGIASCYYNLGVNNNNQGRYPEGLNHLLASLKVYEEIGNENGIAGVYNEIGITKLNMHAAKEAKEYLLKGVRLATEIGAFRMVANGYDWLSVADSALGDFRSAFEHNKLFMLYNDSLNNEENTKKITQQQMQYEFDKKQIADSLKFTQENELASVRLQKQKAITYGGFAAAAITILLLFFVYRNYSKQRIVNQKLKEAQEQLIKSEKMAAFGIMASRVSHEIQNPLNFVNNFSELAEDMIHEMVKSNNEQERNETAKDLLNNLQKIKQHGMRADSIVKQLQEHTNKGTAHEYFEVNSNNAGSTTANS